MNMKIDEVKSIENDTDNKLSNEWSQQRKLKINSII